jgi:RimJ/RimL family protein N-acetyltransferase
VICQSRRLGLRPLTEADAPFLLELLNDPDWHRHIGDRGVRSLDDARAYVRNGPMAMYARHGFGLWAVEGRGDEPAEALGICGLLKRDTLDDIDLGFAFLACHRGRGLALEAARLSLDHAREVLGKTRVLAITSLDNHSSIRLLERLGFHFERILTLGNDPTPVRLFAWSAGDGASGQPAA